MKFRGVIVFLDFDGTLAPIVDDPAKAVMPESVYAWLKALEVEKRVKTCVITGRSLKDVRKRVGLRGLIYAGNHGMEIYRNGRHLLKMGVELRRPLRGLAAKLKDKLSALEGVQVEYKGLSVAVHYRKAEKACRKRVKKTVSDIVLPLREKYGICITGGKMICEVRPASEWNKGKAALWIWRNLGKGYLPLYVGDDITDEDAFSALKPYGITVRIGKRKDSNAEYYIRSIRSLIEAGFPLTLLR